MSDDSIITPEDVAADLLERAEMQAEDDALLRQELQRMRRAWYDQGAGAFASGVANLGCPYLDPDEAVRVGVRETEHRLDAVACWQAGWTDAMWSVLQRAQVQGPGEYRMTAADHVTAEQLTTGDAVPRLINTPSAREVLQQAGVIMPRREEAEDDADDAVEDGGGGSRGRALDLGG